MKAFVFLDEFWDFGILLRWRALKQCVAYGREPDDNLGCIPGAMSVPGQLYFALEVRLLPCGEQAGNQQHTEHDPALDQALHLQNNIPIAKFTWLVTLLPL